MFTPSAIKVLEKRYLQKDDTGAVSETPEQLFRRVAGGVAQAEKVWSNGEEVCQQWSEKFFQSMYKGEFLPNSPTLFNAGKPKGQLSACFVLPVPDTLEGIFETCKNAALIHKTGGGTGFSFSRLRPANDRVATTSGVASGPVSFMTVYDAATEAIRQGWYQARCQHGNTQSRPSRYRRFHYLQERHIQTAQLQYLSSCHQRFHEGSRGR